MREQIWSVCQSVRKDIISLDAATDLLADYFRSEISKLKVLDNPNPEEDVVWHDEYLPIAQAQLTKDKENLLKTLEGK